MGCPVLQPVQGKDVGKPGKKQQLSGGQFRRIDPVDIPAGKRGSIRHKPAFFPLVNKIGTKSGNIFLFQQFFANISREYIEAAQLDGASQLRIFFVIMMPLSAPIVATVATFAFIGVWNDYIWPLISLYTKEKYTLQLALRSISAMDSISLDWGLLLGASVLTMIPVLVIFVIFNKQIMSSSMSSGIKG